VKSPIRILAIDGGGVGGVIPARLLDRLQALDPRVVGNADLVAGTSTRGLIAQGLAAGKTPRELCDLYRGQAQDIFSRSNRRYLAARGFRAKFAPDGLRRAVEAIAGRATLGELTAKTVLVPVTAVRRPDGRHSPAGVFLSTASRLAGGRHEKYASSQWKCVDVALATAAAPTYFPAHEVADPGGGGGAWLSGTAASWPTTQAWPPWARCFASTSLSGTPRSGPGRARPPMSASCPWGPATGTRPSMPATGGRPSPPAGSSPRWSTPRWGPPRSSCGNPSASGPSASAPR